MSHFTFFPTASVFIVLLSFLVPLLLYHMYHFFYLVLNESNCLFLAFCYWSFLSHVCFFFILDLLHYSFLVLSSFYLFLPHFSFIMRLLHFYQLCIYRLFIYLSCPSSSFIPEPIFLSFPIEFVFIFSCHFLFYPLWNSLSLFLSSFYLYCILCRIPSLFSHRLFIFSRTNCSLILGLNNFNLLSLPSYSSSSTTSFILCLIYFNFLLLSSYYLSFLVTLLFFLGLLHFSFVIVIFVSSFVLLPFES